MKLSRALEGYKISELAERNSLDTVASYEGCWRLFTRLKGDMEIEEITHRDLQELFYWLRTEYVPLRRNRDTHL